MARLLLKRGRGCRGAISRAHGFATKAPKERVKDMADHKVTVEQLPNGKWACFLHLPNHDEPVNLGREFNGDEHAENWLNVSESVTAIEMMVRKHRK
jgi:hypothetical protein